MASFVSNAETVIPMREHIERFMQMIETIRSFPSPNLGICLKNLVEYHVSRHGIVRSLWIELNGSIKAVSPTYRCVTSSHYEAEFPLCGHMDFSKTGKFSLYIIFHIL